MPAPASSTDRVQFGVFELDLQRAELRKQGVKVKLQEQPLKVLQILLENPGQIVSREELRQRVWPANTFVDFDQGLYSAMARLREALGDSPENPRFIETVARRGYRFIAPVHENTSEARPKPTAANLVAARRWIYSLLGGLLGGTLLLAIIFAFDLAGVREWLRIRTTPLRSIAVLPLENLSGDPEQEYFADGMTDELITDLAQLPTLQVISRTSVMRYKRTHKTLPEVARELNVDAVVEGTVARSGNHVRIRVQLVRAGSDRHLWAQAYERELGDVLQLQTDAAREIAEQVGTSVAAAARSQAGHTRVMKPEAYESYLKGRYYSHTRKREDVETAKGYFLQAIQEDPDAALGYAGLADTYLFEFNFGSNWQEAAVKTRDTARKALAIDPSLSEPHVTLGILAESFDWNWAEAEVQYKRATELEPSSPSAHLQHAFLLAALGRPAESVAEVRIAEQLDPLSANTHATAGFAYLFAGDFDRAIEQSQKALAIDPAIVTAHAHLIDGYMEKGMYDQAVREFAKYAPLRDFSPESVAAITDAYQKFGIKGFWQEHLDLNAHGRIPPLDNGFLASTYAVLGNKAKAMQYLEKAFADREPWMEFVNVTPELRSLRSEPRFQELVRRVGLPASR